MTQTGTFKSRLQIYLEHSTSEVVTIADILDRYLDKGSVIKEELKALQNFEKYRVHRLKGSSSTKKFNKRYMRLQVLSNLAPYQEFLKPKYS